MWNTRESTAQRPHRLLFAFNRFPVSSKVHISCVQQWPVCVCARDKKINAKRNKNEKQFLI